MHHRSSLAMNRSDAPKIGSAQDLEDLLQNRSNYKQRIFSYFSTQHRAVTPEDYKAITYGMPAKFGAIKRAACVRDFDEFKRNLNIYVISENSSGKLTAANETLKVNLKNWLAQYKMVNDTLDLLDATIVNFKIDYLYCKLCL